MEDGSAMEPLDTRRKGINPPLAGFRREKRAAGSRRRADWRGAGEDASTEVNVAIETGLAKRRRADAGGHLKGDALGEEWPVRKRKKCVFEVGSGLEGEGTFFDGDDGGEILASAEGEAEGWAEEGGGEFGRIDEEFEADPK